jgi:hypothetical protein
MKKMACIAIVLALTAVGAHGETLTTAAQGALQMKLVIDKTTGAAELVNLSGAPYDVERYEIHSAAYQLAPAAWYSIADAVAFDAIEVIAQLGSAALPFGEFSADAGTVEEGALDPYAATFQPGVPYSIGNPVALVLDAVGIHTLEQTDGLTDLSFFYETHATFSDKALGVLEIVPEPATLSVLLIGGIGLIRRRRPNR